MRDFIRQELPAISTAGERIGSFVTRATTIFAVLAGVGAGRIAGEVLASVAFAFREAMRPEGGPLPFQVRELIAPAVAVIVARRAGGIGGAAGYVAYAGIVVLLGWLGRAVSCGQLTDRDRLPPLPLCDQGLFERLPSLGPLLVGLAIGAVVARAISDAPRAGSNALLEAAGVYTVVQAVLALGAQTFALHPPQPAPAFVAYVVGTTVLAGVLAGFVCARRSSKPLRTAVVLSAVLMATWLYLLGWTQFAMTAAADWPARPELLLFATPMLGAVLIIATAALTPRARSYALAP